MRAFKASFYDHTQQFQLVQNNAFNLEFGGERLEFKDIRLRPTREEGVKIVNTS